MINQAMGNIFSDITEDINLRPTKSKILLKWVIRIAVALIILAFGYGQYKVIRLNKMAEIEKAVQEQTKVTKELKEEMNNGFEKVNGRIDKVYDDGIKSFNDHQMFTKKQLELVIDFGQTNKILLKQMLDLNISENNRNVENNLQQAKTLSPVVIQKDSSKLIIKKIK